MPSDVQRARHTGRQQMHHFPMVLETSVCVGWVGGSNIHRMLQDCMVRVLEECLYVHMLWGTKGTSPGLWKKQSLKTWKTCRCQWEASSAQGDQGTCRMAEVGYWKMEGGQVTQGLTWELRRVTLSRALGSCWRIWPMDKVYVMALSCGRCTGGPSAQAKKRFKNQQTLFPGELWGSRLPSSFPALHQGEIIQEMFTESTICQVG